MNTFRRTHKDDNLAVVFDDGHRMIVVNGSGNVMFDGTKWLFEACWARGYFVRY